MSVGTTTRREGNFGVLGPGDGRKTRSLVDEDGLEPGVKEALEADDFIIYGKASVEKYDEDNPPQKILMSAFDDKIPHFLDGGIISRRHKDIPVGEPVESYTLDEPAEIEVGDQTHSFDAGEELRTEVSDGEVWIVANLRNDSELARETREGAINGNLDGFSVTVFCKEWDETSKGQEVHSIDWHSTTIGQDQHIKNPDSRFGVAEFKAMFESGAGAAEEKAERAAIEVLRELPTNMSETNEKSFWERVKGVADQKAEEAEEKSEGTEDEKADDPPDSSPPEMKEEDEKSDFDAVMEKVEGELGEADAEVIQNKVADDEEDEDEFDPEEGELKSELEETKATLEETRNVVEKLSESVVTKEELDERVPEGDFVTKSDLDERVPDEIATKSELEEVTEKAEKAVKEVVPDAIDGAAEKMVTSGTPSPSGGSTNDEDDYKSEIEERFGSQ